MYIKGIIAHLYFFKEGPLKWFHILGGRGRTHIRKTKNCVNQTKVDWRSAKTKDFGFLCQREPRETSK